MLPVTSHRDMPIDAAASAAFAISLTPGVGNKIRALAAGLYERHNIVSRAGPARAENPFGVVAKSGADLMITKVRVVYPDQTIYAPVDESVSGAGVDAKSAKRHRRVSHYHRPRGCALRQSPAAVKKMIGSRCALWR